MAGRELAGTVASTFFFLRAFHVDATVETTLAVLVVGGLSTMLPFTPGGAGTQQAILVFALAGAAASSTILAFSFGQQLVITIVNVAIGFGAILLMLGTLRWRASRPGRGGRDQGPDARRRGAGRSSAGAHPGRRRSRAHMMALAWSGRFDGMSRGATRRPSSTSGSA